MVANVTTEITFVDEFFFLSFYVVEAVFWQTQIRKTITPINPEEKEKKKNSVHIATAHSVSIRDKRYRTILLASAKIQKIAQFKRKTHHINEHKHT